MKIKCSHNKLVSIDELILLQNPKNNNKHPAEQIKRLAKIIDFAGQRKPIVVSNRSGFIIKGHGALLAMAELGWDRCAVDYQDYDTEAAEYQDMTADNEIAKWAIFDRPKFEADMEDLDLGDFELLGIKDYKLEIESEPKEQEEKKEFIIIIECKDETEQSKLFEKLSKENIVCKIL